MIGSINALSYDLIEARTCANLLVGSHFDRDTQREILDVAREHDIVVFADEIFR